MWQGWQLLTELALAVAQLSLHSAVRSANCRWLPENTICGVLFSRSSQLGAYLESQLRLWTLGLCSDCYKLWRCTEREALLR